MLERVLVELVSLHLEKEPVLRTVGSVRVTHTQKVRVFAGVGACRVTKHAYRLVGGDGFQHHRAGTIRVDEAVSIVRVTNSGESLRADHERSTSVPGREKAVGLDQPLKPAGATEWNVIANGLRTLDFEQ